MGIECGGQKPPSMYRSITLHRFMWPASSCPSCPLCSGLALETNIVRPRGFADRLVRYMIQCPFAVYFIVPIDLTVWVLHWASKRCMNDYFPLFYRVHLSVDKQELFSRQLADRCNIQVSTKWCVESRRNRNGVNGGRSTLIGRKEIRSYLGLVSN